MVKWTHSNDLKENGRSEPFIDHCDHTMFLLTFNIYRHVTIETTCSEEVSIDHVTKGYSYML